MIEATGPIARRYCWQKYTCIVCGKVHQIGTFAGDPVFTSAELEQLICLDCEEEATKPRARAS